MINATPRYFISVDFYVVLISSLEKYGFACEKLVLRIQLIVEFEKGFLRGS